MFSITQYSLFDVLSLVKLCAFVKYVDIYIYIYMWQILSKTIYKYKYVDIYICIIISKIATSENTPG